MRVCVCVLLLHHHNEKEEKDMSACVERENFCFSCSQTRKSASAREGKQMWCDEGGGGRGAAAATAKIIECVASRVVRLLVHADSKDKAIVYYHSIDVEKKK